MPKQQSPNTNTPVNYRKRIGWLVIIVILAAAWFLSADARKNENVTPTKPPADAQDQFDKTAYSLTDPTSPWVVVNKQHPLQPIAFTPNLVTPTVAVKPGRSPNEMKMSPTMFSDLNELFAAAAAAGHPLRIDSAYRSYQYQIRVYNSIVASSGQSSADEQSARPGYSEHQTGLAVDVVGADGKCSLNPCFASTPAGQWLAAKAFAYGFIVRYTADKIGVTGYEYEPWHLRYVGKPLAAELHRTGIETLEEFFSVTGGSTYK
jgi:D-alanyl-D-alanine carboxypeptidase